MLHEQHINEMKHFRSKAKSWEIQKHHMSASNMRISASTLTIKHLTQKTISLSTNLSNFNSNDANNLSVIASSTSSVCAAAAASNSTTLTSTGTTIKFE